MSIAMDQRTIELERAVTHLGQRFAAIEARLSMMEAELNTALAQMTAPTQSNDKGRIRNGRE